MRKYNLDEFLKHLHNWVDSFKLKDIVSQFSVKNNQNKPSLYGLCDMVYNLVIPNQLEKYLKAHDTIELESWIKNIQSYQNPQNGWFKEGIFNYGLHFKEHSTAFAVSALKLLGKTPEFDFKFRKKLNSQKKVEKWLKRKPEWGLLFWPGSHRGGGIASIFATLGEDYYPHKDFFNWYFNWLDKMADPKVGFWRIGWNHKIANRLTKHELGGSIHYYWIYEFFNRPIPYPEKVIDSTLKLQNSLGLWDNDISYCIDLDAIFSLNRCCKQTDNYKKEHIKTAIEKYLDYTIDSLNNRNFLFNQYKDTHKLTGCLEAIAEIQKFYPEFFDLPEPWIETLDITPWI
jgi:hypothetical protein